MGRLEGKVAVVTGAARGIGRATAILFAREGARLVANDLDHEPLEETAGAIRSSGGSAFVSPLNTVELERARRLMADAVDEFGKIDILVNNAGTTRDRMFHKLEDEEWDTVIDANLRTAFHCALAAMPYMREAAKGEIEEQGVPAYHRKITFTSSTAALAPSPGQANYAAAKGAIISLTKTLARELGPFHINVNAVAPGFIETRLTAEKHAGDALGIPADAREEALRDTALGYFGHPEDVANAHLFLASSESDFVSGTVLPVSGGLAGV